MKSIDVKSLLIGALLTSTIFLGVAATGPFEKWDEKQRWSTGKLLVTTDIRGGFAYVIKTDEGKFGKKTKDDMLYRSWPEGWEPLRNVGDAGFGGKIIVWEVRKRIK